MATKVVFFLILLSTSHWVFAKTLVFSVGSQKSFKRSLPALKYANLDAERFNGAMRQVGMVRSGDISYLKSPSSQQFMERFRALIERGQSQEVHKFIFYFSGHADDRGLHFKDRSIHKRKIHDLISQMQAKTKVVFFDSCFSGALLSKGVKVQKGFDIPKMSYSEPMGSIFLSATSSSDYAYESGALRGSLFTKNLIAGLYGEGDTNQDGVVTATELYVHAYQNTKIDSHMYPVASLQVPEFSSQLKGRGAVALSFPAHASGGVLLDGDIKGDLKLYAQNGVGFYNYVKKDSRQHQITLPAARYKVLRQKGGATEVAIVDVSRNQTSLLAASNFKVAVHDKASTQVKGQIEAERSFKSFHKTITVDYVNLLEDNAYIGIEMDMPLVDESYLSYGFAHGVVKPSVKLSGAVGYRARYQSLQWNILGEGFWELPYKKGFSMGIGLRAEVQPKDSAYKFRVGAGIHTRRLEEQHLDHISLLAGMGYSI